MPQLHAEAGTRRAFLAGALLVASSLVPLRGLAALGRRRGGQHPTPRPGITAAKVLTPEQLKDAPDSLDVFNMVREIPEIVDGIRCQCGCADIEGFYSLLSCYEGEGAMARDCMICQGEGRLAYRLHKAGESLDSIRAAIDARFG